MTKIETNLQYKKKKKKEEGACQRGRAEVMSEDEERDDRWMIHLSAVCCLDSPVKALPFKSGTRSITASLPFFRYPW